MQIPQIFFELQTSVQAVLLGAVMETDWSSQGVPDKSLVEQWSISLPCDSSVPSAKDNKAAIASDGQYLYVHGPFGLLKVGSGYGNTKKVGVCRECVTTCVFEEGAGKFGLGGAIVATIRIKGQGDSFFDCNDGLSIFCMTINFNNFL